MADSGEGKRKNRIHQDGRHSMKFRHGVAGQRGQWAAGVGREQREKGSAMKFTKQMIKLAHFKGVKGEIEVEVAPNGILGVNSRWTEGGTQQRAYHVTHIPTGAYFAVGTKRECVRLIRAIHDDPRIDKLKFGLNKNTRWLREEVVMRGLDNGGLW